MIKTVDSILRFKSQIKIESVYNFLVVFILLLILILSTWSLVKPIQAKQHLVIESIAAQSKYPMTQEAALNILQHERITFGQYLKLMYAYQTEERKAKELPAVNFDKTY